MLANGCSNETNVHCVLPPSHTKHQINECVRDGIWCNWQQMKYISKLMSDILKFLSLPNIFSVKKTTTISCFFLFHKPFRSHHGGSTIGSNRHAVILRKLMFLYKGIYFFVHFLSCGMFDKWTAKEKLFHVVLSRRGGSSRRAAGLQPSLKNVQQKIPPNG